MNVVLASLIVLLGLPAGLILAKIAKEELKDGEKYFLFLQDVLFILTTLLFFSQFNVYAFFIFGILSALFAIKVNLRPDVVYPLFIVMFLISMFNQNLIIYLSSMMFLYGLPTGALVKK